MHSKAVQSAHTHTHTFFFTPFPIIGYCKMRNRVPWAMQWVLVVYVLHTHTHTQTQWCVSVNSILPIFLSLQLFPLVTINLLSKFVNLFLFCKYVQLYHFLDFTNKWYYLSSRWCVIFVFLCLTSPRMVMSRSIYVAANGSISLLFMVE